MDPQTLEVKQELMRARYEQRRRPKRKRTPRPNAEVLYGRAKRRLAAFKLFLEGRSPAEIADTLAFSGTRNGMRPRKSSSALRSRAHSTTAGTSSRASTKFSATVMAGTSVKC